MPGVSIRTATRSGPGLSLVPEASAYFVAGLFDRGPVDRATRVRSLTELAATYGPDVAYSAAYTDLRVFFEEGGGLAYVTRVVGPAATSGSLTLVDRAGVPVNTLRVDAVSPGAWSAGVTVEVQNGTTADTFRLLVREGTDVETYDNLTSPADAVAALSTSRRVRAVDLGSPTAAPGNNPAVRAATALSAGADDRAAVTAAMVGDALARFGSELPRGVVALPGYAAGAVGAALIAHARTTNRLALLATPAGTSRADAAAAAASFAGTAGAEHAGIIWPHVRIPAQRGTRLVSPEGYAAAARTRALVEAGPWRAPAGEVAVARYVSGVEAEVTRAQGDELDDQRVSVIRTIAGTTRLYGWRSLSTDEANYALLTARDTVNLVVGQLEAELEADVWRTIDGTGGSLGVIEGKAVGVLEPIARAGGLFARVDATSGDELDPGYSVAARTPLDALANGRILLDVALRPSPVGTLIDVTVTKAALTAAV